MTFRPAALLTFALLSCGDGLLPATPPPAPGPAPVVVPPWTAPEQGELRRFESLAELEAFVTPAPPTTPPQASNFSDAGSASGGGAASGSSGSGGGSGSNTTITNNQEQGVDEGDIVKNVDDLLLVLRKGRLYAASVAVVGQPTQTDSIRVAEDDALNRNVWYDEMLVKGREIFVIGYRYLAQTLPGVTGATELAHFRLAADGTLQRVATRYLQSYDYYSSRDYASRLIGDTLVLYSPLTAQRWWTWQPAARTWSLSSFRLPQKLAYLGDGRFALAGDLFQATDVFRPAGAPPSSAVFHAFVRCTLDLECTATPLLGSWANGRYLTAQDAFLKINTLLYRLSLSTGAVSAHAIDGYVRDQFGFQLRGQVLHVLSTRDNVLRLLSLPLADFDSVGAQDLAPHTRVITTKAWWIRHERFFDDHFLVAFEDWNHLSQTDLVLESLDGRTHAEWLLSERVTRIEPMAGLGALVVSADSTGLLTRALDLTTQLLAAPQVMSGVNESETRSHGFFFRPERNGGTFGLSFTASRSGWWGTGVSNLAFFSARLDGAISLLATTSSTTAAGGTCEVSCIDWYGNTRPIFLGQRAFALMGSELQELDGGALTPVGPRLVLGL